MRNAIKGAIVMKGDKHEVTQNTVVGKIEIVRTFGIQFDMNEETKVEGNLANRLDPRGKTCQDFNALLPQSAADWNKIISAEKSKYKKGLLTSASKSPNVNYWALDQLAKKDQTKVINAPFSRQAARVTCDGIS